MSRGFNPADYDTVESRIRKFWTDHPQGRVLTELVHRDEKQYIVRADVYTDRDDARPAATGYAEEIVGTTPVNKTSALENCETSAIGRALANLNYAAKARPSREEMEKAQRRQEQPAQRTAADARAHLAADAKRNGWDIDRIAGLFAAQHEGRSIAEAGNPQTIDKFRESLYGVSDQDLKAPAANGSAS